MAQRLFQLVTHVLCPYVQRSVILLKEKDIAYKRTDIDLANPPEWFRQISPTGKVPLLLLHNNRVMFESAVICEYIDEVTPGSLHPDDPEVKASHRSWIEFGSGILNNIAALYNAPDKLTYQDKLNDITLQFTELENVVSNGPYFEGSSFHLVDAVYGPVFRYFDVFEQFADIRQLNELGKITQWRSQLRKRPSVEAAVSAEYSRLLKAFITSRHSYMSSLVSRSTAA